uniref:Clustered mitochondria protein homolog n=1 Tax=Tanacetum cinerariifolium TaxID=118510 RepID=A0A6L2KDR1_TANCI|nr:clustered mitochondria protein [Tanacetum cinerariifolium]
MAGKSSRGKNKKGSQNAANASKAAATATANVTEPVVETNGHSEDKVNDVVEQNVVDANEVPAPAEVEAATANPEVKEGENASSDNQVKQGDIHLFPVPVKTQFGEKLELQLSPSDSVMDVRQFLLDAPETCFFTCYDLLLHTKDGSSHHLEDYHEISEVADITTGDCSLEMIAALYDDRSIRAHVHRTRELLSLSTLHSSLSTSLALQHESNQNAASKSEDATKSEVLELENLGFMEDVSGSLSNLLSSPSKEIKCVESIVFSSFNPPPSYRRLVGDLIYLDVVTLEGSKYCITGTTTTFYVNSSSGNTLDPKPTKAASEATTLIGLLQKISSKFKKAFREMLERKASAHPFENIQSLLPPNPWLGLHPVPEHRRDAARAENSLTLSFGSELIGMQRDWNEELQSCREFPHASHQERILRDRALYKVSSDFVDAAISGAIGVISRCIPPINPTDPECFHMYVHNNIFFSFAVDADLEQLSKKQTLEANLNPSEKALAKSSTKVNGDKSSVATVENGAAEPASDTPSEAQLAESEQATYASSNNDLKGTKAYQEADVPGLYNLAMAIVDYRGHRVVAQSVLPGILQGDKSDSLLYGSVDNGKKICWNEDFHAKVLEASKRLRVKEHTVLDGSGNVFQIAAPVECKGIVGSDDRHYLLDLMRVTPRDANYTGANSKFCILRPELITAFCQAKGAKNSKSKPASQEPPTSTDSSKVDSAAQVDQTEIAEVPETSVAKRSESGDDQTAVEESGSKAADVTDKSEDICFNPNVFTEFKLAGNPEEIAADEESVRKVSLYLKDSVLPKFILDLCTLEVSPMDGQTLTEALHAHGINVRYIGRVADGIKHLPHLSDLCSNEIIVRCAKHILKDVLRDTADHDIGQAVAHFFNCLFGDCQIASGKGVNSQSKIQKKDAQASGKSTKENSRSKAGSVVSSRKQASCLSLSSESLWSDILEFAKVKYQFELLEDARSRVKNISVIRNLCLKVGVSIAAKKYDLSAGSPFQTSDILNLQPVVKHSIPVCQEAKELIETGKVQLAEGMLNEAYTLFTEAFTILQQVTGPMHREVANCCRYLAMVLYHAGDMAAAIMQQHKELIINERCLGLDHPDTAHSYGNMALFYHGLNQSELALRHMSRALLLLSLSSGPDHPDVAATYINVAMMYQDIGKMNTALRYLQEALKKNERLLGEEHIQTAVCYHALAIAFNCVGAYKLSHQHEKKTYDILVKQLGEDDSRTRDSQNWMKTFKVREAQMNAQKQKGQAANAVSAQAAIDLIKAHPDLMQAFQAASGGGASGSGSNNAAGSENVPRGGRGVDERSARAIAEARKKAAARGLLIRPHGVPVQALPPLTQLTQLLNIVNSGTTPENGTNEDATNGAAVEPTKPEEQGQTPVGLSGSGLDPKKQKQNQK